MRVLRSGRAPSHDLNGKRRLFVKRGAQDENDVCQPTRLATNGWPMLTGCSTAPSKGHQCWPTLALAAKRDPHQTGCRSIIRGIVATITF